MASSSISSSNNSSKNSSDLDKKGPIKSRSVPPMMLSTIASTSIDYEAMSGSLQKASTTASGFVASAPISASSSRSESPLSDRYCGKCSSLISLHLRTIGMFVSNLTNLARTFTEKQLRSTGRALSLQTVA